MEGLADLLRAETEAQRRQALQHSGGAVRRQYEAWRATLLTCLARVEVGGCGVQPAGGSHQVGGRAGALQGDEAGGLHRKVQRSGPGALPKLRRRG